MIETLIGCLSSKDMDTLYSTLLLMGALASREEIRRKINELDGITGIGRALQLPNHHVKKSALQILWILAKDGFIHFPSSVPFFCLLTFFFLLSRLISV
jgi:hypothetical protein